MSRGLRSSALHQVEGLERALEHSAKRILDAVPPPFIERLYRYTSFNEILSILTSGSIWLTNALDMPDQHEVRRGYQLLGEVLDRTWHYGIPTFRKSREVALWGIEPGKQMEGAYIYCFSDQGDLEHQWQAFAGEDSGFCICYDVPRLLQILDANSVPIPLMRVTYEDEELCEALKHVAENVEDAVFRLLPRLNPSTVIHFEVRIGSFTASQAARLVVAHKQAHYRREQEWRLVRAAIGSRETPGLRPDGKRYFPLNLAEAGTIPVHSITYGTRCQPEAIESVRQALAQKGWGNIPLTPRPASLR